VPASRLVTFDIGQTLLELDLDFLAARLALRGLSVRAQDLSAAAGDAWRLYDALTESGASHPWHELMNALLAGAGVADRAPLVDWLYEQQLRHNLWRKPIAAMIDLVRALRDDGVRIAAVSNSEGGLRELLEQVELAPLFDAIIDSAEVGIAKPDPGIFAHTLEELGGSPEIKVHVGDSWAADVEGALAAGWNAIWYRSRSSATRRDSRVPVVRDAAETRAALSSFGV
jgi:FMN hydrolase / 5-amino-6-(5-phospho-D-ribitylamino)uracil phosphatase